MFLHFLKYEKLDTINDLSNEFKQKIENYKDKIKIFHFQFFYYLTIDLLKNTIDFFTEKKEITYCKCTHGDSTYSKQNLQSFCVEGLFIQGIKDCNLSFSIEPYVCSKMEISIKKLEKYFLFIKEFNLINDDFEKTRNDTIIDFDMNKLIIEDIQKSNEISDYSDSHKLQVNDDAFVINCTLCGTPNVIDEHNQTYQCSFCSGSLF